MVSLRQYFILALTSLIGATLPSQAELPCWTWVAQMPGSVQAGRLAYQALHNSMAFKHQGIPPVGIFSEGIPPWYFPEFHPLQLAIEAKGKSKGPDRFFARLSTDPLLRQIKGVPGDQGSGYSVFGRELLAARYFAVKGYQVTMGLVAYELAYDVQGGFEPIVDVIAYNPKTNKVCLAEGKGRYIDRAFTQMAAMVQQFGLDQIEELLLVIPDYALEYLRIDHEGYLMTPKGVYFGLEAGPKGRPVIRNVQEAPAGEKPAHPIRTIVVPRTAEERNAH